jgi:hypothetical protein
VLQVARQPELDATIGLLRVAFEGLGQRKYKVRSHTVFLCCCGCATVTIIRSNSASIFLAK